MPSPPAGAWHAVRSYRRSQCGAFLALRTFAWRPALANSAAVAAGLWQMAPALVGSQQLGVFCDDYQRWAV
jgi:hypothetical protein